MGMAYPTLLWFAGYSNVSSVVIVVIGFICMAIFIALVSMNADLYGTSQTLPGVEQRNMVKVVNPFFLQLENEGKCLKDGIKFHLSRLCPCKGIVLWGVHINNFHNFILENGHEMRRKLLSQDILETLQLDPLHQESFQFANAGDDTVSIPCPASVNSSSLGSIPRQRYPVVVLVFVPESPERTCPEEEGDSECSNNIVCLISVIHLKDENVSQSSHVIQQYIKTAGVPIYSLKPLFVNAPSYSEKQCHERDDRTLNEEGQSTPNADEEPYSEVDDQTQNVIDNNVISSSTGCSRKIQSSSKLPRATVSASSDNPATTSPQASSQPSPEIGTQSYDSTGINNSGNIRRRRQTSSQYTNQNSVLTGRLQRDESVEDDFLVPELDNCEKQTSNDKPRSAECVVCQTMKDMCVLLPCRHVCVCYKCFKLLDKCPMCRGALESYFLFSSESNEASSSNEDNEEDNEFIHGIHQPVFDTSLSGRRLNAFQ